MCLYFLPVFHMVSTWQFLATSGMQFLMSITLFRHRFAINSWAAFYICCLRCWYHIRCIITIWNTVRIMWSLKPFWQFIFSIFTYRWVCKMFISCAMRVHVLLIRGKWLKLPMTTPKKNSNSAYFILCGIFNSGSRY